MLFEASNLHISQIVEQSLCMKYEAGDFILEIRLSMNYTWTAELYSVVLLNVTV